MKYRYEEFTWPEIRSAVAGNRVAVLPVGTVEQHGPHLPLVTDVLTASEISRLAVERDPARAILMPPVYYSFNQHHLDFPGTIAVAGDTVIRYVTDIGLSLAHHGFRKILLVNGHGSNVPFLDIAARNITNQTEAICAMVSWWSLIPKPLFTELRESEKPGGILLGSRISGPRSISGMVQPILADRDGGRSYQGYSRERREIRGRRGGSDVPAAGRLPQPGDTPASGSSLGTRGSLRGNSGNGCTRVTAQRFPTYTDTD
jgi:hypothetical protein